LSGTSVLCRWMWWKRWPSALPPSCSTGVMGCWMGCSTLRASRAVLCIPYDAAEQHSTGTRPHRSALLLHDPTDHHCTVTRPHRSALLCDMTPPISTSAVLRQVQVHYRYMTPPNNCTHVQAHHCQTMHLYINSLSKTALQHAPDKHQACGYEANWWVAFVFALFFACFVLVCFAHIHGLHMHVITAVC
jgi:hypothetical protein